MTKPPFAVKSHIPVQVKDADRGLIEMVFAMMEMKDLDNDWTLPGAFEEGAEVVISAYGHTSWRGVLPIGKGIIRIEGLKALCDGQIFMDTQHGADSFRTIKQLGGLNQFSYGYNVLATGDLTPELRSVGVQRVLKRLQVIETAPVLVGAGLTELVGAKAHLGIPAESVQPTPGALGEFARYQKARASRIVGQ